MDPNQPHQPDNGQAAPLQSQSGYPANMAAMPSPTDAALAATPTSPPVADSGAAWLPPTVPVQAQASQAGLAQMGSTPPITTPAIADDGDLIEKEWVMHVKQIVDHTRQDPYRQTKELHKLKAEYMKKRYNKIIEPVEE